jgi:hypothetical protein
MKKTLFVVILLVVILLYLVAFYSMSSFSTIGRQKPVSTAIPCMVTNDNYVVRGVNQCTRFNDEIEFTLVKDGNQYSTSIKYYTDITSDINDINCWLTDKFRYCSNIEDHKLVVVSENR